MPRSLARSLLPCSLPRRSAPSPPAPHTPSPPLPRPEGSLGGGGSDPGQAASEGCASSERDPLAPRAELPGSRRVRSQGGELGGVCAREPAPLAFPTWARRPPEPRQSSEAGSSSGTTKTRLSTEPPLPPGPSPVGSALLHLLESRHRHRIRFTSPLTKSLAFRPVAWDNPEDQQHHWPPLPPAGTWPTPTTLQPPSYCSGGRSCGGPSSSFQPVSGGSPSALWELSEDRAPGPKTLGPPKAQACPKSSVSLN